jgi:hypothetical protein
MLDLSAVRDRLAAALLPVPVAGAAALAGVMEGSIRSAPAAWLVPLAESGGANELIGALHQQLTVTVSVLLAVRNVSDAQGDAALGELATLRRTVRDSLLNWTPADLPGGEPFRFLRGGLLSFANAIVWWQDQFQVRYTLRAT